MARHAGRGGASRRATGPQSSAGSAADRVFGHDDARPLPAVRCRRRSFMIVGTDARAGQRRA
ncbi:hypothetical protein WJ12_08960 [Burkholderia seminalis]|nr:hypothetical protein WJ12_08960 [Burkholderia seminalis]RQS66794.1 hypothetical protein DF032_36060 [Burkholderia seminalis]